MQLPALLGEAPPALAPCFALAALAALRCEEILRLEWSSLHGALLGLPIENNCNFSRVTLLLDPAM